MILKNIVRETKSVTEILVIQAVLNQNNILHVLP